MRIINAHTHLYEMSSDDIRGLFDFAQVSVLLNADDNLPLLNPSELLKQMDNAGVEMSVLFAEDSSIIHASNEYVEKLCRLCPDRFIGFGSLNPKNVHAPQKLEQLIEQGLRGLSLNPPMQEFAPNDPKIYPLYHKAEELGIPIAFHAGSTPMGARCRLSYANPIMLDDVAVDFPNLKIIITHLGTLYHNESFMVAEKNANVYIDTAAYLYEIPKLLTEQMVKRIGEHKILFGSNYPMPFSDELHCMKDFVDCIKSLPLQEETKRKIFSENFLRMLDAKPRQKTPKTLDLHITGI